MFKSQLIAELCNLGLDTPIRPAVQFVTKNTGLCVFLCGLHPSISMVAFNPHGQLVINTPLEEHLLRILLLTQVPS